MLKLLVPPYDVRNKLEILLVYVFFANAMLLSAEGLRQAPKVNQPFIPDTAPARRSQMHGNQSPQPTTMSHTHSMSPANPDSPHISSETWEGKEYKVPMSTRDVWTPGNRPSLFSGSLERAKLARQADFYDPYFPLRFIEVPKCKWIDGLVLYALEFSRQMANI